MNIRFGMRLPSTLAMAIAALSAVAVGSAAATDDELDAAHAGERQDRAVVVTRHGAVRGIANQAYRSFRGIPYAAPPLGRLRWAPPAPVEPWAGVLNATQYRHNCLQPNGEEAVPQPRETLSEDCLYLNVFTPPSAHASSSLPVLLYIHGGGYQGGGSNESRLNGSWNAARFDALVVTTNYRLNIFGFLASAALRARDRARGTTGNYGILDQRAAMRWVQDNIRAFGGDPSRVLLFGESAGGASVYNHVVRPASWGLFSRALAESGAYTLDLPSATPLEYELAFQYVLSRTGCANVTCLEGTDADALLAVARCEHEHARV